MRVNKQLVQHLADAALYHEYSYLQRSSGELSGSTPDLANPQTRACLKQVPATKAKSQCHFKDTNVICCIPDKRYIYLINICYEVPSSINIISIAVSMKLCGLSKCMVSVLEAGKSSGSSTLSSTPSSLTVPSSVVPSESVSSSSVFASVSSTVSSEFVSTFVLWSVTVSSISSLSSVSSSVT